jgi:ubiquinone/menaquinone biosynthesis C-methylase UbiE
VSNGARASSAQASLEEIPERLVPEEASGQLVEAEHMARYRWASRFCSGRRVLDAGCGAGYGAEMIAQAGAIEVVGVDVSEVALELARSTVGAGVTLEQGDVAALDFDDDSFDIVVCFEVIEHVDDRDRVLDELARVLRPDGLLLISSPNRDRYVPGNPHHRHEYVRDELQAALDARFPSARIISQHVMIASVISWAAAPLFEDPEVERMAVPAPEDEIYLLAMAGKELPPDASPVATLGLFAESRRWLEFIEGQRRQIEDQAAELERFSGRERERLQALERLAEAEQELAASRTLQVELETAREELRTAQEQLGAALGREHEREELLQTMISSRSWRMTAPVRRFARDARRLG